MPYLDNSSLKLQYCGIQSLAFWWVLKIILPWFLLMNANETSIARGQNSLTHLFTQCLVNCSTHGVHPWGVHRYLAFG